MASDPLLIAPGHGLGFMTLGASLHHILSAVKEDKAQYPAIDLHVSQSRPHDNPVIVALPKNGLRLRFDGADQRLRLIEVLDFGKVRLAYKGSDLVRKQEDGHTATFKRIYQLFGASYPGEYIPPKSGHRGTYVLSWPGVAFNFSLQHSAWSPEKDHVSLLGSHAASAATHMAVFEGNSWPEARGELFVSTPSGSRIPAVLDQYRDMLPAELEQASIQGSGKILFNRRPPALPFTIVLGQTTPQDLLTEIGAPDATHQRDIQMMSEEQTHPRPRNNSRSVPNGKAHATPPSSYSSTGTDTFDTDFDSGDADDDTVDRAGREKFWCYFGHGLDILVGPPSDQTSMDEDPNLFRTPLSTSSHLVVLKVVIHGNIPSSYAFNRHRRLRWTIALRDASSQLNSEHSFEDIKADLMQAFHGVWPESEMGRGKVVNRTWGADPSESSFFLPDAEQDLVDGGGSEQWLGNTKLYSFPGLTFEVLSNGAISALTVS